MTILIVILAVWFFTAGLYGLIKFLRIPGVSLFFLFLIACMVFLIKSYLTNASRVW